MSKYKNVQQQIETLNVTTSQPVKSSFVTGIVQMQIDSNVSRSDLPGDVRAIKLDGRGGECTIYVSEKDIETFKALFQQQPQNQ